MGPKVGVVVLEHSSRNVLREAARSYDVRGEPGHGFTKSEAGGAPSGAGAGAGPESTPSLAPEALDFAAVYEAHLDFVWRSLRLLGVPRDAIEDVVQDTFDVVSRQLARFEGRSSLRTWLFGIAQRTASNYRRMARRKLSRLEPLSEVAPSLEPTPQAQVEALESAAVVERFVSNLDAEWRAVFVLAVLEGVPGAEVADALGISANAVYSRVYALREALRREFERNAGCRPGKGPA